MRNKLLRIPYNMDKLSHWIGNLITSENTANTHNKSYQTYSVVFLYKSTIL